MIEVTRPSEHELTIASTKSYDEVTKNMTEREKELLEFLYENAKGADIVEETINLAEKEGYTREEVKKLCTKMVRRKMFSNFSKIMGEFWYYINAEFSLIHMKK